MLEILPNWHPLFVHFTVALYTASFLFFVLGRVFFSQAWSGECLTAAYWTLWLGAIISVFTVAAGFYAFNTVRHDALSHAAMTDHRNWALATAGTWWLIALWSLRQKRKRGGVTSPFLAGVAVAVVLLMSTGWKGGELVYRHGLGVLYPPKTENSEGAAGQDHAHEENEDHHHGDDHSH